MAAPALRPHRLLRASQDLDAGRRVGAGGEVVSECLDELVFGDAAVSIALELAKARSMSKRVEKAAMPAATAGSAVCSTRSRQAINPIPHSPSVRLRSESGPGRSAAAKGPLLKHVAQE